VRLEKYTMGYDMITEKYLSTMVELLEHLNSLPNNFIYRGQSDAGWSLDSTLERLLGSSWSKENARKFEDRSISVFKSKYHIYQSQEHSPKSKLSWLSVMQHYGTPTRLIDFSESPYIALYFALESYSPLSDKNFSIFAIDYTAVMEKSISHIKEEDSKFSETRSSISVNPDKIFEDVVDRFSYNVLWITEPMELNARIDRQSGTFLLSGNREKTIDSVIASGLYDGCSLQKLIVNKALFKNCYALLRKMGINSKSIYGDLAGLSKSIKMELQTYT